ncbi:MAG: hypothetical protein V3V10_01365 [Planctomycetota bacterium]
MYEGYQHTHLMLRKKVFSFLGQKFHIYGPNDQVLFFVKQKAFKLKEDIRVFTGEDMLFELLCIKARGVIDIGMTYDVLDSTTGENLGSLRRKGLKSILRDEWHILDAHGQQIGTIIEDSMGMALVRRLLSNLVPQTFNVDIQGQKVMEIHQRFNPFVAKIDLNFSFDKQSWLDRRIGVAAAVLMSAIEGRQG